MVRVNYLSLDSIKIHRIYSMKTWFRILFICISIMPISRIWAQSVQGKSNLVFVRATGKDSKQQLFSVYVDGVRCCGLPNNNYTTISVDAGEHSIFANNTNRKKIKKQWEASSLSLNLEAGKTYYINLVFTNEVHKGVSFSPILESSAKQLMASCSKLEDKK